MSETVIIYLIVAITILLIIYMLRHKLKKFLFKGGGVETEFETYDPGAPGKGANSPVDPVSERGGVTIKGNRQFGRGNVIEAERDGTSIEENEQIGEDQRISTKSDKSSKR